MPSIAELQDALINADKAGDAEAARRLADAIVAARNVQEQKPVAAKAGSILSEIPRQLGLTARYALEGPAQAAEIVTEPIRQMIVNPLARWAGVSEANTTSRAASDLADRLGLPKPQGADERVVGDMARMVAGSGGTVAAGRGLAQLPGMVGQVGGLLAANPAQQALSAAGAGGGAGAVRENGGSEVGQALGGLLGGVAAPLAAAGLVKGATAAMDAGKKALTPARIVDQQVENNIRLTMERAGFDWRGVDERTKQAVRAEARRAMELGGDLDAQALRRLVDFQQAGITPTRAQLSRDPADWSRERNLTKIAANSQDKQLQRLAVLENEQNTGLIGLLNEAGAGRGDLQQAGETVTQAIARRQAELRAAEKAAWDAAKSAPGYTAPISAQPLSEINRALGEQGLMPFMNPTISRYMEAFQTGAQPFTPQAYRNLQSMLSNELSRGGNEAAAAGLARRVLEASDMMPLAQATNPGNLPARVGAGGLLSAAGSGADDAIAAVNKARAATRAAYAFEDASPLVRSVLSDGASADPARIAKRFVINGTANEAQELAQRVGPEGMAPIRAAILDHIKERALSGKSDEVGKFSASAYTKALNSVGERKLSAFFTPDEIKRLRQVERVADYMMVDPKGSAVNHSGSGIVTIAGLLDFLGSAGARMPLGLKDTITGTIQGHIAKQTLTPARGLLAPVQVASTPQRMAPGLIGGLLAAPQVVNQP